MLVIRTPQEVYRQVDFDARVYGANPQQLVDLCLEQFEVSISRALFADTNGENILKSTSMARAIAALTSLILGIDSASPVSSALSQLYNAARRTVLDSVVRFDRKALSQVRADFHEIRLALLTASAAPVTSERDQRGQT